MIDLRTEYLARIAAFPGVAQAAAHDGELDDEEVTRIGVARTPAVLVTCLGADNIVDDFGPSAARALWVAVVIARGADSVREGEASPGDVAAALAFRVAHELRQGAPFTYALEPASSIRVANLVGTRSAKRGHAIWAVTWQQATGIRPESLEPILNPLKLVHTDYNLGPADSAIDTDTDAELEGA